jgi:hypothetical protein
VRQRWDESLGFNSFTSGHRLAAPPLRGGQLIQVCCWGQKENAKMLLWKVQVICFWHIYPAAWLTQIHPECSKVHFSADSLLLL